MLKILCGADLHMGRRPTRIPSAAGLSSTDGWRDLVDHAITHEVDVVLLAGDIVDLENRYFEVYGPLEEGIGRLKDADISLAAVAGNHDHKTLPDLAKGLTLDHMVTLGRGGEWDRWTLRDVDGSPLLHVDGWSFPDQLYPEDPTRRYTLDPPADGAPVIGLLHCDLDDRHSKYAPVQASRLRELPIAAWVLGHIHIPDLREEPGRAPLLYPGSVTALHPKEAGRHGAWMLEVEPDRAPEFRHIALSRSRYEAVTVDVEGVDEDDEVRSRVARALRNLRDRIVDEDGGLLDALCCQLRLTGRTSLHSRTAALLKNVDDFAPPASRGIRLIVQPRAVIDTAPALDLEALARGNDAPALLARVLAGRADDDASGLTSMDDDPVSAAATSASSHAGSERSGEAASDSGGASIDAQSAVDTKSKGRISDRQLLAEAVSVAARVAGQNSYNQLPDDEDLSSDPHIAMVLRRQASRLLDRVMREKETA